MKKITYLISGVALLISVFAIRPVLAQDPTIVDSKHYKVEFENSAVRVLRVHYGAKEKSIMHVHPNAVVVALTATNGKFSFPSGKPQMNAFKAGQVAWTPATTHLPENRGGTPFDVILVELKSSSPSGSDANAAKDDPKDHKVEFENDQVRVLRTRLAPHKKTLMHSHPDNVVIFLTNGMYRSTSPDGTVTHGERKAGDVMWRDALRHQTENTGSAAAETIVIELK